MLTLLFALAALAADDDAPVSPPEDAVIVRTTALDAGILEWDEQAVIGQIMEGSPAWEAGVRPEDTLVRIDGYAVKRMSPTEVRGRLSAPADTALSLELTRDGEARTVEVVIAAYDPHNGVVWDPGGSRDVALWCDEGDCEDGTGRAIDGEGFKHVGAFVDGTAEGYGVQIQPDGSTYEGGFADGRRHGPGVFDDAADVTFSGAYVDGIMDGLFTIVFPDGGTYEGEVRAGLPHGEGVRVWPDGRYYRGDFQYGDFHGEGLLLLPSGERYEGSFQNNVAHGEGVLDLPRGDHLEGTFYKGRLHGQGLRRWADDGREYRGRFVMNEPDGEGVLRYASGDVFRGTFVEGRVEGFGMRRFQDAGRTVVARWTSERRGLGYILNGLGDIIYEGWIVDGKAEGWGHKLKRNADDDDDFKRMRMYFNDKPRGDHPRSVKQGREERDAFEAFDWARMEALREQAMSVDAFAPPDDED